MSCELYQSEMYAWRPGTDDASFQPLFSHIAGCPECARLFERLTTADQQVQSTFQKLPQDRSLESRIGSQWFNRVGILAVLAPGAAADFAAIPGKEEAKGATWKRESTLDMGPIGKYENTYHYTFDGPDKDKKQKITVKTDLKYTAPGDNTAGGGLPFKIKSADLTCKDAGGTILFDAEKGRVEQSKMDVTLTGKLSIEIGGQATAVDLDQKQSTTVTPSENNPIAPAKPK